MTHACVRSFATTLEAWESRLGRVPDRCRALDMRYDVYVTPNADMPCETPKGYTLLGCMHTRPPSIYIRAESDATRRVDTSVHEWVHALAHCVTGSTDPDHLRAELWEGYGATSVETQAQAAAVLGECL